MKPVFFRREDQDKNVTCLWKRKFKTKEEAKKAHAKYRAYRCPYCNHWHLTSKP